MFIAATGAGGHKNRCVRSVVLPRANQHELTCTNSRSHRLHASWTLLHASAHLAIFCCFSAFLPSSETVTIRFSTSRELEDLHIQRHSKGQTAPIKMIST
jgi:hypothetical protein